MFILFAIQTYIKLWIFAQTRFIKGLIILDTNISNNQIFQGKIKLILYKFSDHNGTY